MRRGQVTIFILLGIVLVLSVVILWFARESLRPEPDTGEVRVDVTLARTCLSRTTDNAIRALSDDGFILMNESGPIAVPDDDEQRYLYVHYVPRGPESGLPMEQSRLLLGDFSFVGLCDPDVDAPNGLDRTGDRRYTCDNTLYQYVDQDALGRTVPSVQEQLQTAISLQMSDCLNQTGDAELIIQTDGILVRWDEPAIESSPSIPLHLAFRAINEIVRKEISQPEFSPDRMVDGEYVDRVLECDGCERVKFSPDGNLSDPGIDWYVVDTADVTIRFGIDDRNVSRWRGENPPKEAMVHDLPCDYGDGGPLSCPEYWFATFDDDNLTAEIRAMDLPENADYLDWLDDLDLNDVECGYEGGPSMPCAPEINLTLPKNTTDDSHQSHLNRLEVRRGCLEPPTPVLIRITDNESAETYVNMTFGAADQMEIDGDTEECSVA